MAASSTKPLASWSRASSGNSPSAPLTMPLARFFRPVWLCAMSSRIFLPNCLNAPSDNSSSPRLTSGPRILRICFPVAPPASALSKSGIPSFENPPTSPPVNEAAARPPPRALSCFSSCDMSGLSAPRVLYILAYVLPPERFIAGNIKPAILAPPMFLA